VRLVPGAVDGLLGGPEERVVRVERGRAARAALVAAAAEGVGARMVNAGKARRGRSGHFARPCAQPAETGRS
jgi:hypothetical protein